MKYSIARYFSVLLFIGASLLMGCTSTPSNPRDPFEPMNRGIYSFNDKADNWVMKPVAETYRDYTPQFLRTGVSNFFGNLNDATSSFTYALQGEGKASLYNLSRFLLNSTVGILGLFDVTAAQERTYLRSDFGDTFAVWGWKNSNYFIVPLVGPSTFRDASGLGTDLVFRHNTIYSNPSQQVKLVSDTVNIIYRREELLGVDDIISSAALDPYAYTRDAWLQMRAKETGDDIPKSEDDDMDIDDLMN